MMFWHLSVFSVPIVWGQVGFIDISSQVIRTVHYEAC